MRGKPDLYCSTSSINKIKRYIADALFSCVHDRSESRGVFFFCLFVSLFLPFSGRVRAILYADR